MERKLKIYLSKEFLESRVRNLIYAMKWDENHEGVIDKTIYSKDLIEFYHYNKNSENLVEKMMDFFIPFRGSQQAAGYDVRYLPEITIDKSIAELSNVPNFYFPHNEDYFIGEVKKIVETSLKINRILIDEIENVYGVGDVPLPDLDNFSKYVKHPIQEIQLRARSGLAYKYGVGLYNGIGTIDLDFRGEIKAILRIPQYVNPDRHETPTYMPLIGDRIAQLVIPGDQYYDEVNFIISGEEIIVQTDRGEGGFGSTGI